MPAKATASSSDDSDDEATMRRLREATDSTLLTNSMFTDNPAAKVADLPKPPTAPARKSQRYIEVDERLENDMQVTASMQNFMHKKLNQIIEKRIEFVDVVDPVDEPEEFESSVQLFRDSKPIVLVPEVPLEDDVQIKQKRPKKLKRRRIDDERGEEQIKESDRISASVVTVDDIQKEVSVWKKRVKPKEHYEYVAHKTTQVLHLKEPDNEFTKARKKNNWSENKIARK